MKLSNRDNAILEVLLVWSEPRDAAAREELLAELSTPQITRELLQSLEGPGEALLSDIWRYITDLCDNSTGNAEIVYEFGTDPSTRYVSTGLLIMLAEEPAPDTWFSQALLDPLFNFLLDTRGNEAYDLEDEIEDILKPILSSQALEEILHNLLRLAELGSEQSEGQPFSQVLDGAGLLPE